MDKENLRNKIDEIVRDENYLLIDLNYKGDKRNQIIEIFVDNKEGVTTPGCSVISRKIEEYIDGENLFNGKYRLDVSSPGVERNLIYLDQFYKHINRKFEIEFTSGDEVIKIEAKLKSINNNKLIFQHKKEEIEIPFEKIKLAKVIISF